MEKVEKILKIAMIVSIVVAIISIVTTLSIVIFDDTIYDETGTISTTYKD